MKFALLVMAAAWLSAAPALEVVRPAISQMEGGTPDPPGFEHVPGETLYFTCRITGFTKSQEEKIHLAYSVQAFDSKGVPLAEIYKNELSDEVGPQDKEWTPKIATEIAIPPLIASGEYKIVVKAEDLLAKSSAELSVPFRVRGHNVPPSDTLVVRNFRFFRTEESNEPLPKATYKTGTDLWVKFDITGFKYGPNNKIDINYQISILSVSGKVLWTQPEPAVDQSESFYPKQYVTASFNISLKTVKPAEYTIALAVKDAIGGQTAESKQTFTVE